LIEKERGKGKEIDRGERRFKKKKGRNWEDSKRIKI
jgi:hypothetical protein